MCLPGDTVAAVLPHMCHRDVRQLSLSVRGSIVANGEQTPQCLEPVQFSPCGKHGWLCTYMTLDIKGGGVGKRLDSFKGASTFFLLFFSSPGHWKSVRSLKNILKACGQSKSSEGPYLTAVMAASVVRESQGPMCTRRLCRPWPHRAGAAQFHLTTSSQTSCMNTCLQTSLALCLVDMLIFCKRCQGSKLWPGSTSVCWMDFKCKLKPCV